MEEKNKAVSPGNEETANNSKAAAGRFDTEIAICPKCGGIYCIGKSCGCGYMEK